MLKVSMLVGFHAQMGTVHYCCGAVPSKCFEAPRNTWTALHELKKTKNIKQFPKMSIEMRYLLKKCFE